MNVAPLHGWLLSRLVELDLAGAGLLSHYCLASAERRHVIAAFLSVERRQENHRDPANISCFLRSAGHYSILCSAFGSVPAGLRGALARTAADVQPRRYYLYLNALLSNADGPLRRLIERLPSVDLQTLRIARALPVDARRPDLVKRLTSIREARDLTSFIELISGQGADRDAMIAAFDSNGATLREIARSWVLRTCFPPHPLTASHILHPVSTGDELRRIAIQMRNCMRVYAPDILDGLTAFAVFEHHEEKAVVHLQREPGSTWALQGLHAAANQPPSAELRHKAEAYLQAQGIFVRRRQREHREYDAVRRLTRYHVFEDTD